VVEVTTILSISLPAELRSALDAEAKRQRRSRSFVVAEAVREYLVSQDREAFAAARDRTLREGLALSAADRVRLAEELWKDFARGREPAKPWTATFDTFDQYEQWRRGGGQRTA
jgi:predicted transcriptional regulator